VGIERNIRWI